MTLKRQVDSNIITPRDLGASRYLLFLKDHRNKNYKKTLNLKYVSQTEIADINEIFISGDKITCSVQVHTKHPPEWIIHVITKQKLNYLKWLKPY